MQLVVEVAWSRLLRHHVFCCTIHKRTGLSMDIAVRCSVAGTLLGRGEIKNS